MKNDISLLVGLKNNLEYSKNFYQTTRALYPDIEIVFTSYNSTDGTHAWLDSLNDNKVKYFYAEEEKTFSDTYNKCIELATSTYVAFAHNDIVLAPGFIESLEKVVSAERMVTYTTIEPPIFANDPRPGKIVKDFGTDVQSFDIKSFFDFTQGLQKQNHTDEINKGATFFLCLLRELLLDIDALDPLFSPMFCEDHDLIVRLELLGLEKYISANAICYHFVSKTSRFSEEYQNRTKQIDLNSNKNFVRKWGFTNLSTIKRKYDIGFVVKNGTDSLMEKLEPLCSTIYIDGDYSGYIKKEQPYTAFNLSKKIKSLSAKKSNDIIVYLDGAKLKEQSFSTLRRMNEIIYTRVNRKTPLTEMIDKVLRIFKSDHFEIAILNHQTHEHRLIKRNLDVV